MARENSGGPEDRVGTAVKDDEGDALSGVPEMIRRFAALGLSGFFTTESALRRALGDTVPKDWVEFAAGQSEKTRQDLLDRVASEIGRVMQGVDVNALVEQLLEGRTIEISAQIRLGPKSARPASAGKDDDRDAPRPLGLEVELG